MSPLDEFRAAFKGDILTEDALGYDEAIARWAANAERRAKYICFVKGTDDVALALKFARTSGLKLAIRGGGNDPGGSSSQEGGLIIDLSRYLNVVRVDPQTKLAYVGGGARGRDIDLAADEFGLAAVCGTINRVGFAGLSLGGGFGWLSAEHGLSLDNIVQITLVIADGSVLTACSTENTDLFWAVRGAGSNFGVCTELVVRLHDQRPTVYSGFLTYPASLVGTVAELTEAWWKSGPSSKEGMIQMLNRGTAPDYKDSLQVIPFYNGSEAEGREVFKAFLDLKPDDATYEMPYHDLNSIENEGTKPGLQICMIGMSELQYSASVIKEAFAAISASSTPDLRVYMNFELFPRDKICEVAPDACAFNLRWRAFNVLALADWDSPSEEQDKKANAHCKALVDIVTNSEPNPKDAKERVYGNYVGRGVCSTKRGERIFGDNYPRLQEIKKKYDPDMVFSKWLAIDPA